MSTPELDDAVAAAVRVMDSAEGSYLLTKNWIDEDDIRLILATGAPLIAARAAEQHGERIARAIEAERLAKQPFVDSWISGAEDGYNRGIEQAAAIARSVPPAVGETGATT